MYHSISLDPSAIFHRCTVVPIVTIIFQHIIAALVMGISAFERPIPASARVVQICNLSAAFTVTSSRKSASTCLPSLEKLSRLKM